MSHERMPRDGLDPSKPKNSLSILAPREKTTPCAAANTHRHQQKPSLPGGGMKNFHPVSSACQRSAARQRARKVS